MLRSPKSPEVTHKVGVLYWRMVILMDKENLSKLKHFPKLKKYIFVYMGK
jgi:hypothetical protein